MNIIEVYDRFPTESDCIYYLEQVRWKGTPVCPYCESKNTTVLKDENRHHCNNCNTSFSVTVRTIFHKTKLPLQKWFLAISLILNAKKGIAARQLARDIKVNKDTAWYVNMRIRRAMVEQRDLLTGIVEMDETYIGGKPRKSEPGFSRGSGGQGRRDNKKPVVGMASRNGQIKARPVKNVKAYTLKRLVRENIDLDSSILITDQYRGYRMMNRLTDHYTVNHSYWYVDGFKHTNTIESFWALLKRGIVGQYHKVSVRHLPKYIDEFCYRHNHRDNDDLFDTTILNAVGGMQ